MSQWFYYDERSTKTGPITASALKELAKNGVVKRDTKIENINGRSEIAGNVRGLVFPENPPSQPKTTSMSSTPVPSPFTVPVPEVVPVRATVSEPTTITANQFCTNCGGILIPEHIFCGNCGAKTGIATVDQGANRLQTVPQTSADESSAMNRVNPGANNNAIAAIIYFLVPIPFGALFSYSIQNRVEKGTKRVMNQLGLAFLAGLSLFFTIAAVSENWPYGTISLLISFVLLMALLYQWLAGLIDVLRYDPQVDRAIKSIDNAYEKALSLYKAGNFDVAMGLCNKILEVAHHPNTTKLKEKIVKKLNQRNSHPEAST